MKPCFESSQAIWIKLTCLLLIFTWSVGVRIWSFGGQFGKKVIMSGNGSEIHGSFGLMIFAGVRDIVLGSSVVEQKLLHVALICRAVLTG